MTPNSIQDERINQLYYHWRSNAWSLTLTFLLTFFIGVVANIRINELNTKVNILQNNSANQLKINEALMIRLSHLEKIGGMP